MGPTLEQLRFTVPEIISLIGLVQCVYVLVYMAFRAGGWRHAAVPFLYFLVLGAAFFTDFAARSMDGHPLAYEVTEWALWFMGPPLSILLMIQIANINQPPKLKHLWVVGLVPVALAASLTMTHLFDHCDVLAECDGFHQWLTLTGFLAGVISLFAMWSQRPLLHELSSQPAGRDRYWLILALVIANLFFLSTMLLSLTPALKEEQAMIIRSIWGLGFVYLSGTSLFRIYPQAIRLIERGARQKPNVEDAKLAEKIEKLLKMDKVYHEPAYNRVTLAKELGVSETIISRVINNHFNKTLPQLFNELRVADACQLLRETDATIKTVAEEVGFNSIASFNRVFKEIEGISPGQFREHNKNQI